MARPFPGPARKAAGPGDTLVFGLSFPFAAPALARAQSRRSPARGKTAAPRCPPAFPRRK